MKCENCGNELIGGAIICRVCDHNNARRAVNEWRSRKTGELEKPRQTNPMAEPIIVPRKDRERETEPNLLRFPAAPPVPPAARASAASAPAEAPDESAAYPAWRDQVKEKVRQAREKRSQDAPPAETNNVPRPAVEPTDSKLDQNPIVESALRRIRYASYSQTATARVARASAQPAAAALPVAEKPPVEAPKPAPPARPEKTTKPTDAGNQAVKPRTTKDLAEKPQTRTLTPRTTSTMPPAEPRTSLPRLSRTISPRGEADRKPHSGSERDSRDAGPSYLDQPEPETTTRLAVAMANGTNDSFDTEIIEMPQVVSQWAVPEARPATVWLRTMAGACDFELIASAYLPLFGAYATLNTSLGAEAFFVMLVLLTTLVFIYQLATLLVADRTTGMAMLDLRLVNTDDDEMPVTRRQKMLRAWAATIAFLCPPLNLLITRLNHPNRSLPDLISGTTIVGN